jgi:hypothetical protein
MLFASYYATASPKQSDGVGVGEAREANRALWALQQRNSIENLTHLFLLPGLSLLQHLVRAAIFWQQSASRPRLDQSSSSFFPSSKHSIVLLDWGRWNDRAHGCDDRSQLMHRRADGHLRLRTNFEEEGRTLGSLWSTSRFEGLDAAQEHEMVFFFAISNARNSQY